MTAFVMNVAAWEPVIKEKHWFGMHEYYGTTPLLGINSYTDITSNILQDGNSSTMDEWVQWKSDNGTISYGQMNTFSNDLLDDNHNWYDYCYYIQAYGATQWANFYQTTTTSLPAGTYRLTYDVQNKNSGTVAAYNPYNNDFYVEVGGSNIFRSNNTEWMSSETGWITHTIDFIVNEGQNVKFNFGYGCTQNLTASETPALYVSKLKLETTVQDKVENVLTDYPYLSKITWSGNYLESITVVKNWTGQNPLQQPQTSFYSWLDHRLRFSVENKNDWWLKMENQGENYYNYDGLGLCNISNGYSKFYINNLNENDEFNIEYYRNGSISGTPSPFLTTESTGGVYNKTPEGSYSGNSAIYGNDQNGPVYYKMSSNGNVCINIPSKTIIRSVTIKHATYQKATYETTRITDESGNVGYKTTMTGAGVLEDKRGAVPYITMRFGADNDMTFVRNLGEGRYAASCIIDESSNFNPSTAKLQYPYRSFNEAEMKDRLAEKEWSVFTAELNGSGDGDDFNSIYPKYGSYYYFFPEVNGKLNIQFYCEGSEETPAFWYKLTEKGEYPGQPEVTKINTVEGRTAGVNYYEFEVDVEKGGIYYLCSLPTNINHEHPIIRLVSYSFIPAFRLDPLWYVATDAEKTSGTINSAAELNQDFTVGESWQMTWDCIGNIESAVPYFENKVLKFRDIVYKSTDTSTLNDGGAVIVRVSCASGKATFVLTIPYSAEKAIMTTSNNHAERVRDTVTTRNPNGREVKKWDFFSNILDVGQYKNRLSQLYQEIHKPDSLKADWVNTYMNIHNNTEPIFKSVYDMEGDNADMLVETEGLLFFTKSNQLGIYNENDPSTSEFRDRYIGLIGSGEVWIPGLHTGDRIVIKMGRYGESSTGADAHIQIENAQDAIGTTISSGSDYILGGSHKLDVGDQSIPYGEYHFISTGGHFKLKLTDAPLLKLYSIVIYRNTKNNNATILSENTILGDNREILYTDRDGGATKQMNITLHHFGLGERGADLSSSVSSYRTGSFMSTTPSFTPDANNLHFTYTPAHNMFGSFRARLGVKTKDANQSYVTDYADYSMAVGYRETKPYPYTWDFTDLKKYTLLNTSGDESAVSNADLRVWSGYSMRIQPDDCDKGTLLVSGSQLYAGTTMFEETKGIGIDHYNNDSRRNGVMTMTGDENGENGGLKVNDSRANDNNPLFYGFIVPEVAANNAIYVRATKANDAKTRQAKYKIGSGTETAFTYTGTAGGDDIFAMQMASNASTADVKLCFQGYEVKKIAVATDAKTVNKYGWNTESREHPIDPSLLPYMTGKDFRTYIVTSADKENNTVTLARIDGGSANGDNVNMKLIVPGATKVENEATVLYNGSINACIIRYVDDTVAEDAKEVNLFGNGSGFHLFVPDIHDAASEIPSTNLLKARVTATTDNDKVARDETVESKTFNNYAFTYKYRKVNDNGDPYTDQKEGVQAFYRIVSGGARSGGHQAYLSIEALAASRASSRAAASSQSAEHYDILFQEWDNIEQMKGDVNGDGRFNKLDVNTMADYVAGRPTGIFKGLADMNDDGNIDIVDMTLMIKKITGE